MMHQKAVGEDCAGMIVCSEAAEPRHKFFMLR
ncbi:hypothetical protein EAWG_03634 [Escherichia coli TA008]|nr:hypothetical protein EAWG_03634 [Escherichia coli TA008]